MRGRWSQRGSCRRALLVAAMFGFCAFASAQDVDTGGTLSITGYDKALAIASRTADSTH